MNAIDRAQDMMNIPQMLLPPIALKYVKDTSAKIGICGEVYLTCFAHYAELVEGFSPAGDGLYQADEAARRWFLENLMKPIGDKWYKRLGQWNGASHFQEMPAIKGEPRNDHT